MKKLKCINKKLLRLSIIIYLSKRIVLIIIIIKIGN